MKLPVKAAVAAGTLLFWGLVTFLVVDKAVMPLVVKAGRNVRVPDVVEVDTLAARTELEDAGFSLVVDGVEYDQDVPAGAVTSQNPPAYSETKYGRRIHVLASRGPEMVTMIDVTGISLRQAQLFLREKRLETGTVTRMYSSMIPRNVVMKQSVQVDSLVPLGTLVDLTVSVK